MDQHHTDTTNHSAVNWFLSLLAGFCTVIERASADDIYQWAFRILTLISISLMIIINWEKAMSKLFKKKIKK